MRESLDDEKYKHTIKKYTEAILESFEEGRVPPPTALSVSFSVAMSMLNFCHKTYFYKDSGTGKEILDEFYEKALRVLEGV